MMSRSITFSNARIKLLKRHLLEWDTLVFNQQKVWVFVREETDLKIASHSDDQLTYVDLKNRQAIRLKKIMVRQGEERIQMKVRHQHEEALLEQVFNMP